MVREFLRRFRKENSMYLEMINLYVVKEAEMNKKALRFYAVENFYYTSSFFDMIRWTRPLFRGKLLLEKGESFCGLKWHEAISLYPYEPLGSLKKYCFSSSFISIFLDEFLFDPRVRKMVRIIPAKEVEGREINWTLGSALVDLVDVGMSFVWRVEKLFEHIISNGVEFGVYLGLGVLIGGILVVIRRGICTIIK